MCYGDTITIEVSALNHGITDLNNATQVLEAVNEGHAVARVVAIEHWAEPGALEWWMLIPEHLAIPIVIITGIMLVIGFILYIWPHSEVPRQ